jgi:aminoglycoside phosphotransferase (APT) family kinase protein
LVRFGPASEDDQVPRLHSDELVIDVSLVRRLVDGAFPAFRGSGLQPLPESGSSNVLFRLGNDMLVRMPRQPGGGASIDKEVRWLPFVQSQVAVAVPKVIGIGDPDLGYPERWAITGWLEGTVAAPPAAGSVSGASLALARDLARFVSELRAMEIPARAADDDSLSWYRGERLSALDEDFRLAVEECRNLSLDIDLDEALRVWDLAVEASSAAGPHHGWFHGDLLAENLLLGRDGGLEGVLDFGGLALGDPTVDLVCAWEALDADGRYAFRQGLDLDDATWTVSRGWALFIAMVTFPYYGSTMPRRGAHRIAMAQAAIVAR